MAKRSKFQAALLLRAQPPNAFDVLHETSERLKMTQTFPPGVVAVIGEILGQVLDEVSQVRAIKADEKAKQPLSTVEP